MSEIRTNTPSAAGIAGAIAPDHVVARWLVMPACSADW
jgi:hypothetical protein